MKRRTQLALLVAAISLVGAPAWAKDRVAAVRAARAPAVAAMFQAAKVAYPPGEIYLRAFKSEGELELWAGPRGRPLTLVKTYPICATSGVLGPKRRRGDGQVPEGFYRINVFNPRSNFHLSLGVDYPNASDRILGNKGGLGGSIFIHGSCATIGCIPIEDEPIEEVYLVALELKGRREIPVHIFPRRMDEAGLRWLQERAGPDAALWQFWRGLAPGYELFEASRRPPLVTVEPKTGRYVFRSRAGRRASPAAAN